MGSKIILQEGQKFGKWTVLSFSEKRSHCCYWNCQCECGIIKSIESYSLRKGKTKSCGCSKPLTNLKFGRWSVLSQSENQGHNKYWNCQCECGVVKKVAGYALTSGESKSCGCLFKEIVSLPYSIAAMNVIHRNYTRTAKERNLSFTLTSEEFQFITSSNCYYCGTPPTQKMEALAKTHNGLYLYNGIDRVDNTKGYDIQNCVPCCKICNYAKSNQTQIQFLAWIQKAYENLHLKPRTQSIS